MDSVGSPEEEYIYFVQEAPEGRFLVVERRWENRRLRILTKEQIEGMSAGGFHRYRKKFIELFVDGVNMKNPEAIRAFDYLRHTLAREHRRRDDESFMDRWERARSAE